MNISDLDGEDDFVLNMAPMIDVVFLLLIFFMVSTTFMEEESQIDIELPTAEAAGVATEMPDEITLTVTADGTVYFKDEVQSKEQLQEMLKTVAQRNVETPVTIRGHRAARHENIVTVMDACGQAGLSNLAIGTTAGSQEGGR